MLLLLRAIYMYVYNYNIMYQSSYAWYWFIGFCTCIFGTCLESQVVHCVCKKLPTTTSLNSTR